ncbi:MAG: sensor histidine kinase, partial [Chloroflexota bacterium]
ERIVGYVGIALLSSGFSLWVLVIKLGEIQRALAAINQKKKTRPIESYPLGLMDGVIKEMNTLVAQHTDFQSMRGRLYEQISEVAAQEERNRLARDLHDSIKQQVFSMSVSAAAAEAHLKTNTDAARAALLDVRQSAQEAMVEMRALLQQLAPAPLEQLGFIESLRQQMEALSYRTGAKIHTEFDRLPDNELLPIGAQETLFRIAQEALSNIARHARAKHVTLALTVVNNDLTLKITDDGQGFDMDEAERGMGLNNIERRVSELGGAQLRMQSAVGQGTELTVMLPLDYDPVADEEKAKNLREYSETAYHSYWIACGSLGAGIFCLLSVAEGAFIEKTWGLMALLGFAGVCALAVVPSFVRRYATYRDKVLAVTSEDEAIALCMKMNKVQGDWIAYFTVAFSLPSFMLVAGVPVAYVSSVGLSLLTIMTLVLVHTVWLNRLYLLRLNPADRGEVLRETKKRLDSGIFSTALISLTLFVPGANPGFYWMPQNTDEWVSTVFLTMLVTFGIYNLFMGIYYYHYKRTFKVGNLEEQTT